MPKQIKTLISAYSKKPRGSGIYVRNKEAVYTIWKDAKCVTVGSTEHPGHTEGTVTRNWKDKTNKKQKKDTPIPLSIYYYNNFMGGVDLSDQMLKYYEVLRQTKKYWKTLFYHFIDLASVNAFILYKMTYLGEKISHQQFREKLVRDLCHTSLDTSSTSGSGGRNIT